MRTSYADSSDADLDDAFDQLDALEGAVRREKLRVAAELDRRRAWEADGSGSMAEWISYRRGVSARTGRSWARMARALEELPAIAERMADGRLSEDKVRPLCDLASPDDEKEWAGRAEEVTPAALARQGTPGPTGDPRGGGGGPPDARPAHVVGPRSRAAALLGTAPGRRRSRL